MSGLKPTSRLNDKLVKELIDFAAIAAWLYVEFYNELLIHRKEKIIVRKKGIGRIIYGYSLRLPLWVSIGCIYFTR